MTADSVYMVKGVNDNIDNIISYKQLPHPVRTSIVPFKDVLVYDGMLFGLDIDFGGTDFNKIVEKEYKKENIKVYFSGRKEYLKKEIVEAMNILEEKTKNNTGLVVNFCLSYGGRAEIVDATKKIAKMVVDNRIDIDDIDEKLFSQNLYHELPDVDFLIRTSGENRISNFMLWQISYAEFYFPKTYFPDFDEKEFDKAIIEYTKRDRRFGGINYEDKSN